MGASVSDMREAAMEIEGTRYLVQRRGEGEAAEYSLDRGKTWHPTMLEAYHRAHADGALVILHENEEKDHQEDFEAFVVSMIAEFKDMQPGDVLKVIRDQEAFLITREKAVLAVRASVVGDVDLRMEDTDGKGG